MPEVPQFLTKRDAAKLLKVSVRKVEREIAAGQLVAVKWGRSRRISSEALAAFIASLER